MYPAAFRWFLGLLLVPLLSLPAAGQQPGLPQQFLDQFTVRPLGPANMGGRVTAIAAIESKPGTFYVATASGGLWKTTDRGANWVPLFDNQPTASLGDVAVSQANPDIVWVGTGESNARNSVSWGNGVYKSTDGGKTWANMGLKDSQHIGRIVIHPNNPEIVYVAALGHLWGPSKERGIYRTRDGGKTWEQSKFLDADTGFIDLAMDPSNPEILYAAAYRVRRDAFSGGNPAVQTSPEAGLYKTSDGGKTWKRLTRGLPGRPIGRCGLSIYRKDPRVLYAVIQTDRTVLIRETELGQAARRSDQPDNGGVFRSVDRGETWTKLNDLCPRPFYFSKIRVDPTDYQRVYVLGVTLHLSVDGGQTFRRNQAPKVHGDHHALWINPANPEQMLLGNDGGVYLSLDRAGTWEHLQNLPIGQFYGIDLDLRKPYRIYGGLQDNGSWGGPSQTRRREGISNADWFRILGGDGFYCQADPADSDTVYAEGQYGNLHRLNLRTGKDVTIKPKPLRRDVKYRFNWSSPLLISPHNARTLYSGGNVLFLSANRGDLWTVISADLTRGRTEEPHLSGNTITTIAESPVKAGILYAGSDDGLVHVTRDGGQKWLDVSARIPGIPAERWISRVECSPFAEGTAYLSVDRHRNDDRAPYVFKTTDYGLTWKAITNNLPANGPVHVIRADRHNPELLFVGTEFGLFVSVNGGGMWQPFGLGLPTVAIQDLAIHPRDRELVIATHGRSLFVTDIAPLQQLTPQVLTAPAHLFEVKPATAFQYQLPRGTSSGKSFLAPNPPYGATIWYQLKEAVNQEVKLTVVDAEGKEVVGMPVEKKAGLHRVVWALRRGLSKEDPLVPPGAYEVHLQVGEQLFKQKVRVEAE